MKKFLLDTNIISEVARPLPRPAILSWLEAHKTECAVSSITIAELRYGASRLPLSRRQRWLEEFLEGVCLELPVLSYDLAAASWHGAERARLEKAGTPVDLADSMIAAVAITRELVLVTENERHF